MKKHIKLLFPTVFSTADQPRRVPRPRDKMGGMSSVLWPEHMKPSKPQTANPACKLSQRPRAATPRPPPPPGQQQAPLAPQVPSGTNFPWTGPVSPPASFPLQPPPGCGDPARTAGAPGTAGRGGHRSPHRSRTAPHPARRLQVAARLRGCLPSLRAPPWAPSFAPQPPPLPLILRDPPGRVSPSPAPAAHLLPLGGGRPRGGGAARPALSSRLGIPLRGHPWPSPAGGGGCGPPRRPRAPSGRPPAGNGAGNGAGASRPPLPEPPRRVRPAPSSIPGRRAAREGGREAAEGRRERRGGGGCPSRSRPPQGGSLWGRLGATGGSFPPFPPFPPLPPLPIPSGPLPAPPGGSPRLPLGASIPPSLPGCLSPLLPKLTPRPGQEGGRGAARANFPAPLPGRTGTQPWGCPGPAGGGCTALLPPSSPPRGDGSAPLLLSPPR